MEDSDELNEDEDDDNDDDDDDDDDDEAVREGASPIPQGGCS